MSERQAILSGFILGIGATLSFLVMLAGNQIWNIMARYPNIFCIHCGSNKKMVYDAVIFESGLLRNCLFDSANFFDEIISPFLNNPKHFKIVGVVLIFCFFGSKLSKISKYFVGNLKYKN